MIPTDLTDFPEWQKLVDTNKIYHKAWLDGTFPPSHGPYKMAPPSRRLKSSTGRKGVGDHLEDITSELKIRMRQGCKCKSLSAEMNRLGPNGCRKNRTRLVSGMKKNAQQYTLVDIMTAAIMAIKTGLAWKIDLLDPYGSLLDEAIRRTEKQFKNNII